MPESIVQIEDVSSRQVSTRYGPKTVWNIKASDGRYYGTWDAELGQAAGRSRGQQVEIEYEYRQSQKNGNTYDNYDLKALRASTVQGTTQDTGNAQEAPRTAPVASYGPSGNTKSYQDKDSSIARAVALKAAVELAAGGVIEDPSPEGLVTVSEYFTGWLLTGDGPKAEVVPIRDSDPGDETDLATAPDGSLLKF